MEQASINLEERRRKYSQARIAISNDQQLKFLYKKLESIVSNATPRILIKITGEMEYGYDEWTNFLLENNRLNIDERYRSIARAFEIELNQQPNSYPATP